MTRDEKEEGGYLVRVSFALAGPPMVQVTHLATGITYISAFERDIETAKRKCIQAIERRLGERDPVPTRERPGGETASET